MVSAFDNYSLSSFHVHIFVCVELCVDIYVIKPMMRYIQDHFSCVSDHKKSIYVKKLNLFLIGK